jgi:hypothetical protein
VRTSKNQWVIIQLLLANQLKSGREYNGKQRKKTNGYLQSSGQIEAWTLQLLNAKLFE